MAQGRRRLGEVPGLIGRAWPEVARPVYEFLRKIWDSEADGIPAGFGNTPPNTIVAGSTASAGTENAGWMAADATFAIFTAPASSLEPDSINTEGSSVAVSRADHVHDMSKVMADVMSKVSLGF